MQMSFLVAVQIFWGSVFVDSLFIVAPIVLWSLCMVLVKLCSS